MYAEALNELTASYEVPSWDGSITYTISRNVEDMRTGIKPIRMRAGVPDYDADTYSNPIKFRIKLNANVRLSSLLKENATMIFDAGKMRK